MGVLDTDRLATVVRDFLDEVPTVSLATVAADGRPHAANLNFVSDDNLCLTFLSRPTSAHARHIGRQPLVAVTAYAPFTCAAEIRGVQIHGACALLPASDFDATWATFCAKHPDAVGFEEMVRREERFYRVRPSWLRWIDNGVQFGFKAETAWPPASD